MRIVTRPDFDGIVCAMLLRCAENIVSDILWVEPSDIQQKKADILKGDILANLPFSPQCSLWFDHHISNKPSGPFDGAFDIAPSAARVIYDYYREKKQLDTRYDTLVEHTDIIDAAKLSLDQVRFPENHPYILLSMTIKNENFKDIPYWNTLVALLKEKEIKEILEHPAVKQRCHEVIKENAAFKTHLLEHTTVKNHISITDFRSLDTVPHGNRFLTYCLFEDSIASVKIRYSGPEREYVQLSVGKSIFNPKCRVNIGNLLARFGGGGHDGAGGVTLPAQTAQTAIGQILDVLYQNRIDT